MSLHVVDEARRCLNCKKPLCRTGCPIQTPIPEMIQLFLSGRITEAGEQVFSNNPLSLVCSLVCNHESQCEGHCVLARKGMPIHISSIENYISDNYLAKLNEQPSVRNGRRIGIIGSGPAGLTIAIILARRGYDITVFEGKERIGGVLRYGIPDFRLPKEILDRFEREMRQIGIKIRPNTSIGTVIGIDEMLRDGYDAIFVGTGVWKPRSLGIRGETLGHVHFAINYLTNPDVYHLGRSLIVVGAGNAAMDVARTALRKGVQSVSVYTRGPAFSASKREFEYAKIDGVVFRNNMVPVEITDEGVRFRNAASEEAPGADHAPGDVKLYPADSVIICIGQGPRNRIVSTTAGIDVTQKGLVVTDDQGHTTRAGIFASGDVVLGARTVVEAVALSKRVADAIDEYVIAKSAPN